MTTADNSKKSKKHSGVVVPMVTPVSATGLLDEESVRRVIEFILQGGVDGIFVLGTTGESVSIPRAARSRLVALTLEQVNGRALVYAGLNDNCLGDTLETGNDYLRAGVDAVVAHLPCYFTLQPPEILNYFRQLLDRLDGPLLLYNIPSTTHHSVPIGVLEQLVGHPRLVGLKDSENNEKRLTDLIQNFSGKTDFSILIGVGQLMAKMMMMGADGIVPSVANLAPNMCHRLCQCARLGDAAQVAQVHKIMQETTMIYQRDRTLGQSLAALKAAMSFLGLCGPEVLAPLLTLDVSQRESVRREMARVGIC